MVALFKLWGIEKRIFHLRVHGVDTGTSLLDEFQHMKGIHDPRIAAVLSVSEILDRDPRGKRTRTLDLKTIGEQPDLNCGPAQ